MTQSRTWHIVKRLGEFGESKKFVWGMNYVLNFVICFLHCQKVMCKFEKRNNFGGL